jgi:coenzyme F420 hydrogenase subunit beta
MLFYHDQTIVLHACDLKEGRCFAFCPRTPTDLESMRTRFFSDVDMTPEIGAVKEYLIARATDRQVQKNAQHGGTVTALMSLAIEEGILDTAVLTEGVERFLHQGVAVGDAAAIQDRGKSKFIAAGTISAFNKASKSTARKIGVVTTPCQALALAKMRMKPLPETDNNIDKLKLVIGLFCGWTLSWEKFTALLQSRTNLKDVVGMDIPPGKHQIAIFTVDSSFGIPWDEIEPLIRDACYYCIDTTAEFSDISVGSARLSEDWETARTWNQVIVRTKTGQDLIKLARDKGVLEFREVPAGILDDLKKAARAKKKASLGKIMEKTGNADDLIYVDRQDSVIRQILD